MQICHNPLTNLSGYIIQDGTTGQKSAATNNSYNLECRFRTKWCWCTGCLSS